MTDYRDRVRQERNELDVKLEKLERFLFTCGDQLDKRLLEAQAEAMQRYSEVLRLRIASFPDGPVIQSEDLIEAGRRAMVEHGIIEPRGTPAAIEVTVTAPAGKRAAVIHGRAEQQTHWIVTEGQSQTWAVMKGERVAVRSEDVSAVDSKRHDVV